MQKNIKIFIVIGILGLFFSPVMSYACKAPTKGIEVKEMSCCASTEEQPHSKEDCKKDCCDSTDKDSNDCSGKCGSDSCLSAPTHFAATNLSFQYDQNHLIIESKNSYPIYLQPVYSSGVSSIWQPPKIT